jgi:hypothetical protein
VTTDAELQWWSTTWGRLAPGDEVQAPDGSAWTVGSAIISDGAGEWCISGERGTVWTPHREDDPVTARRPTLPELAPGAFDRAMSLMEAILGPVAEVTEPPAKPGAGRWLLCGGTVCRCRH